MEALTPITAHNRTMRMDIRDIVRELNAALGPMRVAELAGSKDRKISMRWAKASGPKPRSTTSNRLIFAHRQLSLLASIDGDQVARQWLMSGNPHLGEDTPLTAIREGRHEEVAHAVESFIAGNADA